MENIQSLLDKNTQFNYTYGILDIDLEKVNYIIHLIETSRTKDPKAGDRIICVGPKKTYNNGHLDKNYKDRFSSICVQPYMSFTSIHKDNEVHFNTSGGYWMSCTDRSKYIYQEKQKKLFCTWGNRGACAGGVVKFSAIVNVWKLYKRSIY